jgi:probable phosphoglycerate mutase
VQWLRENMECQEKTVDDRMFSDAESRRDEWNRLYPFFQKISESQEEHIIIVSHGDLLSVFNAMWLGLDVESINKAELFGLAGGVSFMLENNDGKHFIKRLSDMSYIIE